MILHSVILGVKNQIIFTYAHLMVLNIFNRQVGICYYLLGIYYNRFWLSLLVWNNIIICVNLINRLTKIPG